LSQLVGVDVPLLAQISFDIKLREGGDEGLPIVLGDPESDTALKFFAIVDQLTKRKKSLLGVPLGVAT
jgi:ATP-binding protein involved in chromosome partitioning